MALVWYSLASHFSHLISIFSSSRHLRKHFVSISSFGLIDDQRLPQICQVSGTPSKLIEQARSILDGNSNWMQSEAATFLVKNEKNEEATVKVEENPHERRPALNRKRARFSLKPDAR